MATGAEAEVTQDVPQHTTCDPDAFDPNPVLLALAKAPASPMLPRRQQRRSPAHTRRERMPLASTSLTGPGRAGTVTDLVGSCGSSYRGQVLAGRPHGAGQLWVPGPRPGGPLQLVYEGEFVRGVRHGQGTAWYHASGDTYAGSWVDGRRTGRGKLTAKDGTVYEGMWLADRRHGVGTLRSTAGAIFVGSFEHDRRQGLGVTFWGSRCRRYVAEYVDDAPTCGTMTALGDADDDEAGAMSAVPAGQLRQAIAAARIQAAAAAAAAAAAGAVAAAVDAVSCPPPQMPRLGLAQPSKVLAAEFAAVRSQREQQSGSAAVAAAAASGSPVVQPTASNGTLNATAMQLLRHAFLLIAGGDGRGAHVLPHQLQELVVLAGLDPAHAAVVRLVEQLRARVTPATGKLMIEDLLDTTSHFIALPASAAAHDAAPSGVAQPAAAEETWSQAVDGDVLAQHIASHRPV